jgi:hypothetical protein
VAAGMPEVDIPTALEALLKNQRSPVRFMDISIKIDFRPIYLVT